MKYFRTLIARPLCLTVFNSLALFCTASLASAETIALFNFENYPAGSTGNVALLDTDPDPRVYDVNSPLLTGITSVSPIAFANASLTSGQNKVESGSSDGTGDDLRVYRWRSTSSGNATASFTVEVASGYAVQNFSVSFLNGNGNYAGTFDVSYDAGSGPVAMTPQGSLNGSGYNLYTSDTVASQITGTVDFVVTFTATNDIRTGRFDDFTLAGDVVTTGPDTDPPTPDPMTWASVPAADGDSSITMTATTATDPGGVEYYFTCTSGGGNDSGWQSSPSYTDTGLSPNTSYTYTVKARDASGLYETAASSAESATTDPIDDTKPSPDPMTFAVVPAASGPYSITMTAATATDDSGVEYYFDETSGNPGGTDSGWQDSPEYTDEGLDPETQYTYTVTARDKSSARNTTDPSDPASATTDAEPVGPVLLGGFDGTNPVDAPKQHSSAIGNFDMELSVTTPLTGGLNPGNFFAAGTLWGTTDLDPDAVDSSANLLVADEPLVMFITATNTSGTQDVTLETLHWATRRDTADSPTTATITYHSGSLTDTLGSSVDVNLGPTGNGFFDYTLSGLLVDRVLAPGETATFTFTTSGANTAGNDRLRLDNVALSGSFSASDYIAWSSGQSWTPGAPNTAGNEDFDGDGLSNEFERIFALDPTSAASINPIVTPLDSQAGTLSYTRRSQSITGLNFPIWYSTDLQEWFRDIYANETPGAAVNGVETVTVGINPVLLDEPKLFLQLRPEPPLILPAPELLNMVGSIDTITINFTEELYQLNATNPANYTVALDGGGSLAVTAAALSDDKKTVTLTVESALSLASNYNVSFTNLAGTTGVPLAGAASGQFQTWDDDPSGIKVFILAGQSNMVGYGNVETGHDGAGTIGSLRYLAINDDQPEYAYYDFSSLLDNPADPANSAWATRSDVKVWWSNGASGNLGGPIEKGDLEPIFGGETATPHTGPEYAFGQILGDYYASDDVLIIKTAWGGRSLVTDFRPPSAVADRGGAVGEFYTAGIMAHVRQILENLGTEFPEWSGRGYQIVGIGWHQGWNDMSEPAASEYKDNLPDLISDLRAEFGKPDLPFVIASTGMATGLPESPPYPGYSNVEKAQLWVVGVPQPANVLSTDTRPFWRDGTESPNETGQGFHWNRNAESYFLVGKALADDMVSLLSANLRATR